MDATAHRSGDGGFALIEVVVSAALLAIAAVAILGGIDGASRSAARERARAVAATLADQDQERMRAMSTHALTDYHPAARAVTVDNVTYSVTSSSDWIRDDSGGTTSCTNDSKQVDYLKITSTVQSNVIGTQTKPVTVSSLVAPPVSKAEGTLAVQVNNRDNTGVAGVPVSLTPKSGGISQSQPTNSVGCAIFQHLPVDTYTVTLASPTANVDTFGQNPSKKGVDVLNGTVQVTTMKWDQAAAVPWTVQTADPTVGMTAIISPSAAPKVSAVNGEEPTLLRTFSATPATKLFPFVTPYAFFTGSCPQENPTAAGAPSDYYSNHVGQVTTSPGVTAPLTTIFQPPVGLRLTDGSNGLTDDTVNVRATLQPRAGDPTPCTETVTLHTRTVSLGNPGYLSQSTTRYDPGLPFGTWDICASRTTGSGKLYAFRSVANANPDATGVTDVPVTTYASSLTSAQLAECP